MTVLGVYKLPVSGELVRKQCELTYGSPLSGEAVLRPKETRKLLDSVVLIELIVSGRNERFNADDFTQPFPDGPRRNWSAAYYETYLTPDGESTIETRWPHAPPGDLRVVFYLHNWDPERPLRTSYGDVRCPPVQPLPERLQRLSPFKPFD